MDDMINSAQDLGGNNEYDAFYAELERQVLTLLDDHDHYQNGFSKSSSLTTKRRCEIIKQTSNYFYWNEGVCDSVPASILSLWGSNNKGTGVFIPQILNSTSKNKPRRKNNNKGKAYKAIGS